MRSHSESCRLFEVSGFSGARGREESGAPPQEPPAPTHLPLSTRQLSCPPFEMTECNISYQCKRVLLGGLTIPEHGARRRRAAGRRGGREGAEGNEEECGEHFNARERVTQRLVGVKKREMDGSSEWHGALPTSLTEVGWKTCCSRTASFRRRCATQFSEWVAWGKSWLDLLHITSASKVSAHLECAMHEGGGPGRKVALRFATCTTSGRQGLPLHVCIRLLLICMLPLTTP